MAWLYLVLAGLFELGWPLGMELASTAQTQGNSQGFYLWMGFSLIAMVLSVLFLYLGQRTVPMGTAYLMWTGIGGVGTALVGIFLFHESADLVRIVSLMAVIAGLMGLSLSHT